MPGQVTNNTANKKAWQGFTIIELLVVIVVIVILSLVVVALYDNAAVQAHDVSLKSDLRSAQGELEADHLSTGSYPASAAQADRGHGLTASPDNTLTYALRPYGYCIMASSPDASDSFVIRSGMNNGALQNGNCDPSQSVIAGNTNQGGHVDGSATNSRFLGAWGIAMDKNGNLFASEGVGKRIRKIATDGTVSTFAGTGVSGYTDGPGSIAQFTGPKTLTFDRNGNLLVADTDGRHIRKITPDGTVSTIVNSSTGQAVWLNRISGLAVDSSNNIYAFEAFSTPKIWKITPAGIVTVLAGSGTPGYADGTGIAAQFGEWCSMTMGVDGNIYVADSAYNRIRKVTLGGVVTTLVGTGVAGDVDGPAGTGQLNNPVGITPDKHGSFYVLEGKASSTGTPVIRIISPDGTLSTIEKQDGSSMFSGDQYLQQYWWGGGYDSTVNSITLGSDNALYFATPYSIRKIIL